MISRLVIFPRWLQVLLAGVVLLILLFGKYLVSPNSFLFSVNGDGIKNYYSSAWYVSYGEGWWHHGMLYPYGEHVVFTDNQPLLTVTLRLVHKYLMPINGYTVGALNLAMLLSLLATFLLLWKILRFYRVPHPWALAGALLIGILSPQLLRWLGHYGLSYTFVVPLLWYLIIKLETSTRPLIWGGIAGFTLLLLGFLHPYYLPIGLLMFTISAVIISVGHFQNLRPHIMYVLSLVGAGLLTYGIFIAIMAVTDPVVDRPAAPGGLLLNRAYPETVFFNLYSRYVGVFGFKGGTFESLNYIGLVPVLACIALLFRIGYCLIHGRIRPWRKSIFPGNLGQMMWVGLFTLLIAMGVPFVWYPELADLLPQLKQFRSLGRLAWIFYFVSGVMAVVMLHRMYRLLNIRGLRGVGAMLVALTFVVWGAEALGNVRRLMNHINTPASRFTDDIYTPMLREAGHRPDDFQAIVPLPLFNSHNESLAIVNSERALVEAMRASIGVGLPIVPAFYSRTSIGRSFFVFQIFSHPAIRRTFPGNLPDHKPLLVLAIHEHLQPWEAQFLEQATIIGGNDFVSLYSLPVAALVDSSAHYSSYIENMVLASESEKPLIYKGFDEGAWAQGIHGRAEYSRGRLLLWDAEVPALSDTSIIEVSVWVKTHPSSSGLPGFNIRHYATDGTIRLKELHHFPPEGMDISNNWVRFARTLSEVAPGERLEIYLEADRIVADAFLVRRVIDEVVLHYGDSLVLWNNFPVIP